MRLWPGRRAASTAADVFPVLCKVSSCDWARAEAGCTRSAPCSSRIKSPGQIARRQHAAFSGGRPIWSCPLGAYKAPNPWARLDGEKPQIKLKSIYFLPVLQQAAYGGVGLIMTPANASGAFRPMVSTATATAIVVADMVGVGVFTSLGYQVQDIPSGFSLLLLWIVGGIVALCGVAAYSELAGMFPRSSGEYNYLARSYHPAIGFLPGWVSATVGFAAPIALAAMAFGEYFKALVPGAPALALGLGIAWLVTLVHLRGVRHGSLFHNIWTVLKLALVIAFLIAGMALGTPQPISFAPSAIDLTYVD